MRSDNHVQHASPALADRVLEKTGVEVDRCYQCGKCSAGCPLAAEMDFPPSQIMHLLQLAGMGPEYADMALRAHAIWLCLTCEICYCRCPMELDIPAIMDALRHESLRRKREEGRTFFKMGVAIHYGRVYLARFFSGRGELHSTVIGRNVNLAGRLSSAAKRPIEEDEGVFGALLEALPRVLDL